MTNYQVATLAATALGLAAVAFLNYGVETYTANDQGETEEHSPGALNVVAFLVGFGLGHLIATPFV